MLLLLLLLLQGSLDHGPINCGVLQVECCVAGVFFREYPKVIAQQSVPLDHLCSTRAMLWRNVSLARIRSKPLSPLLPLPPQVTTYYEVPPSGSLAADISEVMRCLIAPPDVLSMNSITVQVGLAPATLPPAGVVVPGLELLMPLRLLTTLLLQCRRTSCAAWWCLPTGGHTAPTPPR